MTRTHTYQFLLLSIVLTANTMTLFAQNFTDEDRARMIRTESRLDALEKRMEDGFIQMEKRFEQVDKRFEQVDKRFEQIDKRFEQVDKRFEEHLTYIGYIIGLFATICAVLIAFTLWDRRSSLKPLEKKVDTLDSEIVKIKNTKNLQSKIVTILHEFAKYNAKLTEILKSHKL